MLNMNGERELCYLARIDNIEPIIGSDNCEAAIVGGWRVMVRKGTFVPGDLAIYFEIDSMVDCTRPEFEFLAKRHGKIKTQRYTFGGKGLMISQGLLMAPSDFGWTTGEGELDGCSTCVIELPSNVVHCVNDESRFLTKALGVTYGEAEDNSRKANSVDKYKKMAQRRPNIFKRSWARWLMKREWGRKFMFFLFGNQKDKKNGWPGWVQKTDEERVQNMPWILKDKEPWIVTEKIDGTSTTFTMKRGNFGKVEFYVCSRNVCFPNSDKQCYYDSNVYWEMAEKYHVYDVMKTILNNHKEFKWITIQGETFGAGVQKRTYGLEGHDFRAFNFITDADGRWNSKEAMEFLGVYGIPWVPIVNTNFILPDTVDELLAIATGSSVIDGDPREGFVFRSQDGSKSFKAVSNEFLLKYHG